MAPGVSAFALTALVVAACVPPSGEDDPAQVPPVHGAESIEAWLATGAYLAWACEPARHPAFDPSPHGIVRVCTNALAADETPAEHHVDASLVIEIYDDAGNLVGHGAQRHTISGHDGSSWYWFMRVPPTSATKHDATGLAADGWGFDGPALTLCSECHRQAGVGHSGRDFVWVSR